MKIVSVDVRDFRSIKSARVELDRVNWIFGHNRAGKSSFLMAMSSCLLGRGGASVVRSGAKSSRIAIKVLVGDRVRDIEITRYRSKVATPKVDGQPIKRASYHSILETTLGVELPVLETLVEPELFMSKDAKGQVESVLSALGCKIDWDGCQDLFDAWCAEKEITKFGLSDFVSSSRVDGFELLSLIRDSAYSARREARKLAEQMGVSEPKIPADVTQYVRDERLLVEVATEVAVLRKRVASIESKIGLFRQAEGLSSGGADAGKRDEAARKHKDLSKLFDRLKVDTSCALALDQQLVESREKYKAMMTGTCPYCGVTGRDEMAPLLERLKAASLEVRAESDGVKAKIASDYPSNLGQKVKGAAAELAEIEASVARDTQKREILESLTGTDRKALELSMEQAVGRLAVASKIVEDTRQYHSDVATFEMRNKQHRKVVKRETSLDTIVKAFEKEIPVKIVSDLKRKFEDPFRAALRLFFGSDDIDVTIKADSTFNISIVFGDEERQFEDLSQSERLIVGAAAQHAIAQSSSAKILIVDAADVLHGNLRSAFVKGVYSIADQYETIVIASAIGRVDVRSSPLKRLKDTRLFIVEDGEVSPI